VDERSAAGSGRAWRYTERMRRATFAAFALLASAGAWSLTAAPVLQGAAPLELAGTTPCGDAYRAFLGGMDAGAACHAITWRIRIERPVDGRGAWTLTATYGVPPPSDPNLMIDGPKVVLKGSWITVNGTRQDPAAVSYRLTSDAGRTVSFVRISDELVHMLADDDPVLFFQAHDRSLLVGNADFSYTLNRVGP